MPGFAGYIKASAAEAAGSHDIGLMIRPLLHEQHHASASERVPLLNAAVGWVWDTETGGVIQGWDHDRSLFVLLAGEVFGEDSPAANGNGNHHTDAGPMVAHFIAQYEKEGAQFLTRLNGWFSGCVLDLRARSLLLFNDRYGQSRLYYHQAADGFYFASEAKSLLAVLPRLRRIDDRSLAEYFAVGCPLQDRTFFREISLLPPASAWTAHADGRIVQKHYFDPEHWERQQKLAPVQYQERLDHVFSRVAPRYFSGGSRVGISLTGGLDSRMILAWAPGGASAGPCYSFGGPYRDCADVRIARRIAAISGRSHSTLTIGEDFFGEFGSLAEKSVYVTDGAMDVSGAVEIYVNRKARQIAPIRLTGNYGSEILRSNVAFRPHRQDTSFFTPEFARLIDDADVTYKAEAAGDRLSFIAFKQVPWHHHARKALEQSQLTVRSPFLDNELVALAYQAPPLLATSPQPLLRCIAAGNPLLDRVATDRAYRRVSVPILSSVANAWQEFTAKAEYAYDYGMPASLARIDHSCSALHLERLVLGRHKFYHFRTWYKNEMKPYLEAAAASSRLPGCYREGAGQRIIREHLSGQANRTLELHKLLSVLLIERLFLNPA